jgi:tetratricopeptide (TPR) repeat protein
MRFADRNGAGTHRLPIEEISTMRHLIVILLLAISLPFVHAFGATPDNETFANREEALASLTAAEPSRRAEAIAWIAQYGTSSDDAALRPRLKDENPFVRHYAEQGLWLLWSRSGDEEIDALMERGLAEMHAQQFKESIATFTEVIRRKPAFAEGWNRRATVLFLSGELRKSLADCDEVMKRNPDHFGALAGYGQIYFRLEQYEKAIEYWQRALRVNPNMEGVETGIKNAKERLEERRRHSAKLVPPARFG